MIDINDIVYQGAVTFIPILITTVFFIYITSDLFFKFYEGNPRDGEFRQVGRIFLVSMVGYRLSCDVLLIGITHYLWYMGVKISSGWILCIAMFVQAYMLPVFVMLYNRCIKQNFHLALFIYVEVMSAHYLSFLFASNWMEHVLLTSILLIVVYKLFYKDMVFLREHKNLNQSKIQSLTIYLSWFGIMALNESPRLVDNIFGSQFVQFTHLLQIIGTLFYFANIILVKNNMQTIRSYESSKLSKYEDPLTHLPNFNYFLNNAQQIVLRSQVEGVELSIIYFDIMKFKEFNEEYSNKAGDRILIQVGCTIQSGFPGELVSRISDDRFVAIVPNDHVESSIQKIHDTVYALNPSMPIELKAGIYVAPIVVNANRSMISNGIDYANMACRSIKNKDKFYQYYDETFKEKERRQKYLVARIDKAIAEGDIKIYFQPVVCMRTGKVCGYEALTRWIDPLYGFLSPFEFISLLEEYRLIDQLDRYVIRTICHMLKDLKEEAIPVSFNLSRLDFELCDMFEYVEKCVNETGISKDLLHVEVTESVLMSP